VITLGRNIASDKYTCLIGTDNKKLGALAARALAQKLGGRGVVLQMQAGAKDDALAERQQGFGAEMQNYPGIKILARSAGESTRAAARNLMEQLLLAAPGIEAVYAPNDEMALGAVMAAERAGRLKQIAIVGTGGQAEALDAVAEGKMYATIVCPSGAQEALDTALKILRGEKVPRKIELQGILVTRGNAHDPQVRKYAF
jgi:ABC-type sugar transport system substrate-binding protein